LNRLDNSQNFYSGHLIAKNSIYNLLGYGIPLIVAVILIPPLISGLGEERFGLLNLAWIIIGYFSLFDFGIGRALTKIVAEKIGARNFNEIPSIFWTSFYMMLFVSAILAVLSLFLIPIIIKDFIKISEGLQNEALNSFYLLALSIPIVVTTAGLRGFLEAYQKFSVINIIRTILGIFSFLGPVICLLFTDNLFWIVLLLIVTRIVIWLVYLVQCFKINSRAKFTFQYNPQLIKLILRISGWMTITNLIVPIMIYLDRFMIGALISATAITFYATPYEVISKLLLIPGALTGVLFPAFSASYVQNPDYTKKLSYSSVKYIFFLISPLILIILTFAYEGMYLWLGEKFAENSTLVLQFLALGVLFNSLAYIPFSFLQGIGKPDIVAKLQIFEFPIYLFAIWFAIRSYGIEGAAFVWFMRMVIDALVLFWMMWRIGPNSIFRFKLKKGQIFLLLIILISIVPVLTKDVVLKTVIIVPILLSFTFIFYKYFLDKIEKDYLLSIIKR